MSGYYFLLVKHDNFHDHIHGRINCAAVKMAINIPHPHTNIAHVPYYTESKSLKQIKCLATTTIDKLITRIYLQNAPLTLPAYAQEPK